MRSVSVLALGVGAVGLVYVWSAVHGANVSATLRDLLAGHTTAAVTDSALTPLGGAEVTAGESLQTATSSSTSNKAIGRLQAAGYGWGSGPQWAALDLLWTRESGWDNTARNTSSGAYGIAQFLDATWSTVGGSKTSDPTLQIQYGLAYIARRYGTPAAAWAHETLTGWY